MTEPAHPVRPIAQELDALLGLRGDDELAAWVREHAREIVAVLAAVKQAWDDAADLRAPPPRKN